MISCCCCCSYVPMPNKGDEDIDEEEICPEATASFISAQTFSWMNNLITKVHNSTTHPPSPAPYTHTHKQDSKMPLKESDVWKLASYDTNETLSRTLTATWQEEMRSLSLNTALSLRMP